MPRVRRGDVVWVEPQLVAQVEFVEWTHEGRLRAPVYMGLRDDKPASEVRKERAPEVSWTRASWSSWATSSIAGAIGSASIPAARTFSTPAARVRTWTSAPRRFSSSRGAIIGVRWPRAGEV